MQLISDCEVLRKEGYRYVFVDEATRLEDFLDGASTLADELASTGLRIVLTGTDSLNFDNALYDALFGRTEIFRTSWLPWHEWSRIMNVTDIDIFARRGGILGFGEQIEDVFFHDGGRRYTQTAIAENIQHAITNAGPTKFAGSLLELYENDQLTGLINRIVEDINHRTAVGVLRRTFSSSDFGSLCDMLDKDLRKARAKKFRGADTFNAFLREGAVSAMDDDAIAQALARKLGISSACDLPELTENQADAIEDFLWRADLLRTSCVRGLAVKDGKEREIESSRTLVVQHGMRLAQASLLIRAMGKDPVFSSLFPLDKRGLIQRLLSDVCGRVIEEIVLMEAQEAGKNTRNSFDIFTFRTRGSLEVDMVIRDINNNELHLFEIKHAKTFSEVQAKHIKNPVVINDLRKITSNADIKTQCVLLNNELDVPKEISGILYCSIRSFLQMCKDGLKTAMKNFAVDFKTP